MALDRVLNPMAWPDTTSGKGASRNVRLLRLLPRPSGLVASTRVKMHLPEKSFFMGFPSVAAVFSRGAPSVFVFLLRR